MLTFGQPAARRAAATGLRFRHGRRRRTQPSDPSNDQVAWNSFALHASSSARATARPSSCPPTEPIKTGVAVVFGSLQVVKEIGDNPAGLPVDDLVYTFSYTCSVGGTEVRSGEVVATPGTPGVVNGIPAGADCSVTETDAQGGVSSAPPGSPATTTIEVDGTAPPLGAVTVTNDFPIGSFTIDKVVAGTAAADFTAGPYTVDVDCTFQGTEVDGCRRGCRSTAGDRQPSTRRWARPAPPSRPMTAGRPRCPTTRRRRRR